MDTALHQTIVITGSSSGIGLATALQLSKPGINLVLSARSKAALEDAARQCQEKGATVLTIAADVGNEDDIQRIAKTTLTAFGDFDVWINNAGVISYGPFLDFTSEQFEKVIQTNLLGTVYGSRAALQQFRRRQKDSVLINVSSALGTFPGPYASPYVTSKYAVRGFTASLRQEIQVEKLSHIHVCTVIPATIDTPIYQRSANTSGKEVKALSSAYSASDAAHAIIKMIDAPQAEISVGDMARVGKILYGVAPSFMERLLAPYIAKRNYKKNSTSRTDGNLFHSLTGSKAIVSGEWPQRATKAKKATLPALGILLILAGIIYKTKGKDIWKT